MKKNTIPLLIVVLCTTTLFAQIDSAENSDTLENKKKLNLSFRVDYGLSSQPSFIKTRYFYHGESYTEGPTGTWSWEETDVPAYKNNSIAKQSNFKFDLMLSVMEQLNIGLSYKVILNRLETNEWGDFSPTDFFFSIAGTVDYEWQIPKVKNLYLNPTFSIGGFQDNYSFNSQNYSYSRTGTNLFYDAKLALFYRLFDKLGIRVWASYDHFLYRKKRESEIFPGRERVEKIDFKYINYGLGLSYRFFIYPD